MNKKMCIASVFVAILTSACGSSTLIASPTVLIDATSTVAVTATPIPLSQVSLDLLLVQSGDLPAGLSGAQISYTIPQGFEYSYSLPEADNVISQEFAINGEHGGSVTVLLFNDQSNVTTTYSDFVQGMGVYAESVSGIGEEASIVSDIDFTDLAFRRCSSVVDIRLYAFAHEVKVYAQRLDKRLAELVCR